MAPKEVFITHFEYSSIIQAITCGVVPTSGAGMSRSGPMM